MARSFTSIFKFLVPRWLSNGDGGKVIKSLMAVLDESDAQMKAGLLARFPSYAEDDALYLIGQNRKIPRGRTEDSKHYAQRLIRWRYPRGHRTRGSAFALLEQLSEYFGGVPSWSIDVNGNRHDRDAAGAESFAYGVSWVWDSDPRRGRFWIGITPPATLISSQPDFGNPGLWGGSLGLPGYTIGQQNVSPSDADAIRNLFAKPAPWKPSGTLQMWMIVNLDGSTHTPDVTWQHWSKISGGARVPSRPSGWRFWALSGTVSYYTPNPADCVATLPIIGGGYTAVPSAATATVHRSDGTTFTPDATKAKPQIQLVDDASAP